MRRRTRGQCPTPGSPLRLAIAVTLAVLATVVVVQPVTAQPLKDGRGEARVVGSCSTGASSRLRLKARDGFIELEFEVAHSGAGATWHLAIVHERRVAWRGIRTTTRSRASFVVERRLPDLVGTDSFTATAWGPSGASCRATAVLRAS